MGFTLRSPSLYLFIIVANKVSATNADFGSPEFAQAAIAELKDTVSGFTMYLFCMSLSNWTALSDAAVVVDFAYASITWLKVN